MHAQDWFGTDASGFFAGEAFGACRTAICISPFSGRKIAWLRIIAAADPSWHMLRRVPGRTCA